MGLGPNKMKVTSPSPGTRLQRFLVGAGDDDIEGATTSSRQAGRQAVANPWSWEWSGRWSLQLANPQKQQTQIQLWSMDCRSAIIFPVRQIFHKLKNLPRSPCVLVLERIFFFPLFQLASKKISLSIMQIDFAAADGFNTKKAADHDTISC